MNKRKIVAKAARYSLDTTVAISGIILLAVQWLGYKVADGCDAILTTGLVLAEKVRASIGAWENNVPETTFNILEKK